MKFAAEPKEPIKIGAPTAFTKRHMSKQKKPKPQKKWKYGSELKDQEMIAFNFCERLRSLLIDLVQIDGMIPRESSRRASLEMNSEAAAIIGARKVDCLHYIQSICRDHMHWGAELINRGWTVEQQRKAKPLTPHDRRDWIRKNCIG